MLALHVIPTSFPVHVRYRQKRTVLLAGGRNCYGERWCKKGYLVFPLLRFLIDLEGLPKSIAETVCNASPVKLTLRDLLCSLLQGTLKGRWSRVGLQWPSGGPRVGTVGSAHDCPHACRENGARGAECRGGHGRHGTENFSRGHPVAAKKVFKIPSNPCRTPNPSNLLEKIVSEVRAAAERSELQGALFGIRDIRPFNSSPQILLKLQPGLLKWWQCVATRTIKLCAHL